MLNNKFCKLRNRQRLKVLNDKYLKDNCPNHMCPKDRISPKLMMLQLKCLDKIRYLLKVQQKKTKKKRKTIKKVQPTCNSRKIHLPQQTLVTKLLRKLKLTIKSKLPCNPKMKNRRHHKMSHLPKDKRIYKILMDNQNRFLNCQRKTQFPKLKRKQKIYN